MYSIDPRPNCPWPECSKKDILAETEILFDHNSFWPHSAVTLHWSQKHPILLSLVLKKTDQKVSASSTRTGISPPNCTQRLHHGSCRPGDSFCGRMSMVLVRYKSTSPSLLWQHCASECLSSKTLLCSLFNVCSMPSPGMRRPTRVGSNNLLKIMEEKKSDIKCL